MARLTIEQTRAPDLSATSEILANAGRSFDAGIESAKGMLGKYQEGQMAKADASILNDIAKLDSEEALNAYLNSDALVGRQFSTGMSETIMGLRSGVLGFGQDRADIDNTLAGTESTRASTSRANALEGRNVAEYNDGVAQRNAVRSTTPGVIAAALEGRQYGTGAGGEREILAKTLQAEAGGEGYDGMVAAGSVIRNRADNGKYGGNTITGVIMKPGQFSAWNGKTGYADGEGAIDMDNLGVGDAAYAAADAILSGNYQDQTGGATHYYNPAVATPAWGQGANPGSGGWTTIGNHVFGSPDGGGGKSSAGTPVAGSQRVTQNPMGGTAAAQLAATLSSLNLPPDQALKILETAFGAQATGQEAIGIAERKRVDEALAAGTLGAITNPNNITPVQVQQDVLRLGGDISASDRLAGSQTAGALAAGSLAGVLAPNVPVDPRLAPALAGAAAEDQNALESDQNLRAYDRADRYTNEGDIATSLISDLGLESGSPKATAAVNNLVDYLAERAGISPGEAGSTIAEMVDAGVTMDEMIGDRFDRTNLVTLAERLYSDETKTAYTDAKQANDNKVADRAGAEIQISTLQSRAAKLPAGSPERETLEGQADALKDALLARKTPQEVDTLFKDYIRASGIGSRIQGLDPKDPGFTKAMVDLENQITNDKSLSNGEKRLLINKLRG